MTTAATPSTGWLVGYDVDGILKQKDQFGTVIEIGGGPTAGITSIPGLPYILAIDNDSGTYPIIMGTSTYIKSSNGGGQIDLDHSGASNSILISNDSGIGSDSGLSIQENYTSIFTNKQSIELDASSNLVSIYNKDGGDITLGVDSSISTNYDELDEIKISYNTTATSSTSDYDKQSVFIGTRNSSISNGVVNSVVIGGQSLTASESDSVYTPNLFIQGGKSIKSTDSNTIIKLNDNGNTLIDRNNGNYDKSWLLFSSNSTYREFVELGVNSDLGYGSQSSLVLKSTKGPSFSWGTYSSIVINKSSLVLESTDLDTTLKKVGLSINAENVSAIIYGTTSFRGIEYNDDFSASYSVRSLVDKNYVDSQISTLGTPNLSSVLAVGNDTGTNDIKLGSNRSIKSSNLSSGGQINLDFTSSNSVLVSTDNGGLSTAYLLLQDSDITLYSNDYNLEVGNTNIEVGNLEGLKYSAKQTNLQNRSLVDKEFVDTATSSIWNILSTTPQVASTASSGYVVYYDSQRKLSASSSLYLSEPSSKGNLISTTTVGNGPQKIGFDTSRRRIYSTNTLSDNISVLSTTASIIGTVSVGTAPFGIAYDPVNDKIFVSNRGSNNVSVINPSTLLITATISVGSFPLGVAYANSKIYVANNISNNITIINPTNNSIIGTVSTTTPREFTYDSFNENLWFVGVGPDTVGVLDTNTSTIISSIPVGSNPYSLKYDDNRGVIYVSNYGSGNVSVIDTDSYLITSTVSVGTNPGNIEFNNIDDLIYVSNFTSGSISEIDAKSLLITATISTGGNTNGLIFNGDNNRLYALNTNLNSINTYSTKNIPKEWLGVNTTTPSSEVDVQGTITSDGFRLKTGGYKDYVLTSDGSGRGTWQPRIIEVSGGTGIIGSGTSGIVSLSVDFSVVASKSYVDSGTSSIWTAINSVNNDYVSEIVGGTGLNGGGTFGTVTLGVNVDNGLSLVSDNVVLGGTLSQHTNIDNNTNDLVIKNARNFVVGAGIDITDADLLRILYSSSSFTSSIILKTGDTSTKGSGLYVFDNNSFLQTQTTTSGTYSYISAGDNSVELEMWSSGSNRSNIIMSANPQSSNDGSTDNYITIRDDYANKGLVYYDDYTGNFTTHSLVTKGYVDSQVATSTFKYSITRGFTASITETITHSLGTDEVIVQCYDSSGSMVIPGTIQINGLNAVDITFSSTLSSIKTIVIG